MIRRIPWRTAAISISLTLAFLLTALLTTTLGVSYYRRWQASKLLAVVRQFHPGTTTEDQARNALEPFAGYEPKDAEKPDARRDDELYFDITNLPPLRWTLFSVRIAFTEGLVSEIHLVEMQVDHSGYPHPNSASVSIYSNRLRSSPADFNGYSEYSRSTGSVDSQGKWTGFECCHARFIKLDERATPAQLSASFNIQLHCMTSFVRCKDDRQILP
jgi:hypothetical protein